MTAKHETQKEQKLHPEILEDVQKAAEEIEGVKVNPEDTTIKEEEKVIHALKEDVAKLEEKFLLAKADAENARRRARIDVDDAKKFSVAGFAKELLEVAENLQRALDNIPADALGKDPVLKNFADGIEMTKGSLLSIFARNGIERIAPESGDKFDHNLHQAMTQVDSEIYATGEVVDVYQAGYKIHNRLLKAAMVTVAK